CSRGRIAEALRNQRACSGPATSRVGARVRQSSRADPPQTRTNKWGGRVPAAPLVVPSAPALLQGDLRALGLELGLGLLRGLLVGLLQDRLRRRLNQVLGLLQAQAGELAHHLDDLDLLAPVGLEDDVELVLLLLDRGGRRATGRGGRGDRDRGGGGDV